MRKSLIVALFILFALLLVSHKVLGKQGKRDPETGRIRLLYVGDAIGTRNPVHIYNSDPTFLPTLVPACLDDLLGQGLTMNDIHRYMRQYMPKTFEQMRDSYDVMILSDVCLTNFRADQVFWMERCIRENGAGLVMVGGYESFGGHGYPSWTGTPVAEALPVEFPQPKDAPSDSYAVLVVDTADELMRSIPWKASPPFFGLNIVVVREGARELARAVSALRQYPLIVAWRYQKGRSIAFTPDWTPAWGDAFSMWEYYLDFASNLGMYASRVPVPQDLVVVHTNRAKFFSLTTEKGLISALFDFVERFGVNTAKLERRMSEVDGIIIEAEKTYIEQDYDKCLYLLKEAENAVARIGKDAVGLKDRAMMWVYVIEWFAVLGASLFCGVALWLAMVKRKLYHEVSATRSRAR